MDLPVSAGDEVQPTVDHLLASAGDIYQPPSTDLVDFVGDLWIDTNATKMLNVLNVTTRVLQRESTEGHFACERSCTSSMLCR